MRARNWNNSLKVIGEQITIRRKECGYTARELANEAGITHIQLSYIENGKRPASLPTLLKLCRILSIGAINVC